MKKIVFAALLFCSANVFAGDKVTLTGYVGDSHCGAKSNSADHADCAKKCVKGGYKPILVVGDKTYTISNPKKVADYIGDKVEVTGEIKGDAISIDKVSKPAA